MTRSTNTCIILTLLLCGIALSAPGDPKSSIGQGGTIPLGDDSVDQTVQEDQQVQAEAAVADVPAGSQVQGNRQEFSASSTTAAQTPQGDTLQNTEDSTFRADGSHSSRTIQAGKLSSFGNRPELRFTNAKGFSRDADGNVNMEEVGYLEIDQLKLANARGVQIIGNQVTATYSQALEQGVTIEGVSNIVSNPGSLTLKDLNLLATPDGNFVLSQLKDVTIKLSDTIDEIKGVTKTISQQKIAGHQYSMRADATIQYQKPYDETTVDHSVITIDRLKVTAVEPTTITFQDKKFRCILLGKGSKFQDKEYGVHAPNTPFRLCLRTKAQQHFPTDCTNCGIIDYIDDQHVLKGNVEYTNDKTWSVLRSIVADTHFTGYGQIKQLTSQNTDELYTHITPRVFIKETMNEVFLNLNELRKQGNEVFVEQYRSESHPGSAVNADESLVEITSPKGGLIRIHS